MSEPTPRKRRRVARSASDVDRRPTHEDRCQRAHRPHDLLASVEALGELGGYEREVAGHVVLRGALNRRQESARVEALGGVDDLRVRLRDRRTQQDHRARDVMGGQRADPAAGAAQR